MANGRARGGKEKRLAQLIWVDPGGTTGVAVALLDARWLLGGGPPSWEGLATALCGVTVSQTDGWSEDGKGRHMRPGLKESNNGSGLAELKMETEVIETIMGWPDAAFGLEDFILRRFGQDREMLSPVRINAAIEFGVWTEDGRRPFLQAASMAKNTATDERMKRSGLYRAGLPHGTDAARHVATFYRRARSDARLREAAWPELFA